MYQGEISFVQRLRAAQEDSENTTQGIREYLSSTGV